MLNKVANVNILMLFVNVSFYLENMEIFNLPNDNWLFTHIRDYILENDLMVTNTEIHFPVDKSHTHALSSDNKHLQLDARSAYAGGILLTLSHYEDDLCVP